MNEVHEIIILTQGNDERKQELYDLLFDADDMIAFLAAWVFTHFSTNENEWLYDKQNELIDEVLICSHPGKRRLLLTILFRQPLANPPRTDFLDFCLEKMMSKKELPGVRTLCMKLAYEMCRNIPELTQELRVLLEMMEPDFSQASIHATCKNVMKAMKSGKKL